jgi:hypothetical protein
MNKLKEVTEKICELLEGTDLHPLKPIVFDPMFDDPIGSCPIELEKEIKPIREGELLMSFKKIEKNRTEYAIDHNGDFLTIDKNCEIECPNCNWQLGKPLHEQSKETIEFLHEILMR